MQREVGGHAPSDPEGEEEWHRRRRNRNRNEKRLLAKELKHGKDSGEDQQLRNKTANQNASPAHGFVATRNP